MSGRRKQGSMILRGGNLYLTAGTYRSLLDETPTVILLREAGDLFILPVAHAAAGGYLIKFRNSAGDRVINAADFFRKHGLDDDIELDLAVEWSDERAALIAKEVFRE